MSVIINDFEEYEGKYKRVINGIEFDEEAIKGSGVSVYGTTLEQPLMFNDSFKSIGNILYINKTYYETNKEEMDELIIDTLKNTTKYSIKLGSEELINDNFLEAISQNKNIKHIQLTSTKELSKREIDILLLDHVKEITCSVDFGDDFDFLYEYIPTLNIINYPRICDLDIGNFANFDVVLKIDEPLTSEQLVQLQKLFEKYPQESVSIDFANKEQIKEIISIVKSKEIFIKDRKEYTKDDYALFDGLSNDIFIKIGRDADVKPIYLKEREIILNEIVDEVKEYELSPLERYMYIYNIVKLFKEYKKEGVEEKNTFISRHSAFTLFNEYMVCAGYAELLCELADRLNEPNLKVCNYSCTVWSESRNEEVGHRKCLVKIKDEKYGIDGIYISDPTWDHVIYNRKYLNDEGKIATDYTESWAHQDLYNHFLMTKEEVVDERTKYVYPDVTDLLFRSASIFSDEEIERLPHLLSLSQDVIQRLNPNNKMTIEEMNTEIENVSQPLISGEKIIESINTIYSKIFYGTKEQIDGLVQQTVNINNGMHNIKFDKTKNKFNTNGIKIY